MATCATYDYYGGWPPLNKHAGSDIGAQLELACGTVVTGQKVAAPQQPAPAKLTPTAEAAS